MDIGQRETEFGSISVYGILTQNLARSVFVVSFTTIMM